jgi:hypothetical protein
VRRYVALDSDGWKKNALTPTPTPIQVGNSPLLKA